MNKIKSLTFTVSILAVLSACAGEKPTKVDSLQNKDKSLNCDDLLLEINEAEFYRKEAEKSKSLGVKTVIAPIAYLDTYSNAGDAVEAADARVDYLNRIYNLRKCDKAQLPQSGNQNLGTIGAGQMQNVNNVPVIQTMQPSNVPVQYGNPFGAAGSYSGQPSGSIQMQVQQQQYQQPMVQQAPQQYVVQPQYPQR